MEAKFGSYRKFGSCNFCNEGKISASGYDLIYPYTDVYEIEGDRIRVRICPNCIEILKNIDSLVEATNVLRELTKDD